MKKIIILIMSLIFMFSVASAETSVFEELAGMEWSFCSGVGGWSTELYIQPDGSFSGNFHDSEMGDSADGYPNGTIYICAFNGQLSFVGQVDENICRLRVDSLTKEDVTETVEDGVRYVSADSYGISEGETFLLYRPGTPVSALPEEMLFWAHVIDQETPPTELETWFLGSEQNDSGFVGYPQASIANPWEDMTAEQLKEASGLSFGVPDIVENVIYRYLRSESLAEMQFNWGSEEFCARIQPAEPEEGQLPDISGMYFDWENVEEISVGNCRGTIGIARSGDTDWVELCQWYDADQKLAYSLAVYSADPDGLDLTALAEQVYIPAQGD